MCHRLLSKYYISRSNNNYLITQSISNIHIALPSHKFGEYSGGF